jgi:EAL domain-containing protein (putative c-di-GMP-specific phosphodiesterase class I)
MQGINKIEIERAIEQCEFDVYYQPKVDVSGKIVAHESLCRWNQAPPISFFYVAKIEGLLFKLSKYIAKAINLDLKKYPQLTKVSINISPNELKNDDHLLELLNILEYNDRIKFEATEDAAFSDASIVNIQWLRRKGIHLGIDDFGKAQNANLANLVVICPDFVKFDRTLIMMCDRHIGQKLCEKLVAFIQDDMEIPAYAEGIETKEQFELMKAIGFQGFQGFYIEKPHPPEYFFD